MIRTIPQIVNRKKKKSVPIPTETLEKLKVLKGSFHTDTEFAKAMDMDRVTLLRIITMGQSSEDSFKKIGRKLKKIA